ncbi:hypothetical protein [Janibacter indicus]|uniref:hypothetical protein n=1 Tax=Janibacter indicus TaxID=857417 RepID=UPI003D9A8FD8
MMAQLVRSSVSPPRPGELLVDQDASRMTDPDEGAEQLIHGPPHQRNVVSLDGCGDRDREAARYQLQVVMSLNGGDVSDSMRH